MYRSILALFLLVPLFPVAARSEPVNLIFDTDIGNDVDDAIALAMIHALQSRGEVKLLAVTITKDSPYAAPYIDLVNTFYGRPNIQIGMVRNGKTPGKDEYVRIPATAKESGHDLYPHRLQPGKDAPEAVELLEKVLREQPDHSVTVAQVGFSTNLARLLKKPGGRDLVAQKVKLLSLMAGNFQKPEREYNVYTDAEAAATVFAEWPTPMVFSGYEIGLAVPFTFQSISKDFGYAPHHPVVDAYHIYLPKNDNRPSWDPTAVLYAIRPDRGYFTLSEPGKVTLGPKATTVFAAAPDGRCRYLILPPAQIPRVQAVLETLASQPPDGRK